MRFPYEVPVGAVLVLNGRRVLVGETNPLGGVCDDCRHTDWPRSGEEEFSLDLDATNAVRAVLGLPPVTGTTPPPV